MAIPDHIPQAVTAQTAAATGIGAGWVNGDSDYVQVTSSAGTKIVILSDKIPLLKPLILTVGANGYRLGTPAGSSLTINNVDTSGATANATIPANTTQLVIRTLSTGFILSNYTNLGAVATAIVPA